MKDKYPLALLIENEAARHELIEKSVLCITRRLYEQVIGEAPASSQNEPGQDSSGNVLLGLLSSDVINVELV